MLLSVKLGMLIQAATTTESTALQEHLDCCQYALHQTTVNFAAANSRLWTQEPRAQLPSVQQMAAIPEAGAQQANAATVACVQGDSTHRQVRLCSAQSL